MLAGIRHILVITTPHEQDGFRRLLGDGSELGLSIEYAAQPNPDGLAQAFIIGREFVGADRVALALGDNIFYGAHFSDCLRDAAAADEGATVFGYQVQGPRALRCRRIRRQRPGVEPGGETGTAEVVVGGDRPLLLRQPGAGHRGRAARRRARGELEIVDVILEYLGAASCTSNGWRVAPRGSIPGTHAALIQASNYVQAVEERQGLMIACLEEIAFRMNYISAEQLGEPGDGDGQELVRRLSSPDPGAGRQVCGSLKPTSPA